MLAYLCHFHLLLWYSCSGMFGCRIHHVLWFASSMWYWLCWLVYRSSLLGHRCFLCCCFVGLPIVRLCLWQMLRWLCGRLGRLLFLLLRFVDLDWWYHWWGVLLLCLVLCFLLCNGVYRIDCWFRRVRILSSRILPFRSLLGCRSSLLLCCFLCLCWFVGWPSCRLHLWRMLRSWCGCCCCLLWCILLRVVCLGLCFRCWGVLHVLLVVYWSKFLLYNYKLHQQKQLGFPYYH